MAIKIIETKIICYGGQRGRLSPPPLVIEFLLQFISCLISLQASWVIREIWSNPSETIYKVRTKTKNNKLFSTWMSVIELNAGPLAIVQWCSFRLLSAPPRSHCSFIFFLQGLAERALKFLLASLARCGVHDMFLFLFLLLAFEWTKVFPSISWHIVNLCDPSTSGTSVAQLIHQQKGNSSTSSACGQVQLLLAIQVIKHQGLVDLLQSAGVGSLEDECIFLVIDTERHMLLSSAASGLLKRGLGVCVCGVVCCVVRVCEREWLAGWATPVDVASTGASASLLLLSGNHTKLVSSYAFVTGSRERREKKLNEIQVSPAHLPHWWSHLLVSFADLRVSKNLQKISVICCDQIKGGGAAKCRVFRQFLAPILQHPICGEIAEFRWRMPSVHSFTAPWW